MEHPRAVLRNIAANPVLIFERRIAHSPERVWRAVTDPAEMGHWFPASVEYEPRVGGSMRFTFSDAPEAMGDGGVGEVLELQPPEVFAFRWNKEMFRLELAADGPGSALTFTQVMAGGEHGRITAARTAYGWDTCLAALEAWLAEEPFEASPERLGPIERYTAEFGLDEGDVRLVDGDYLAHFARDLVWQPVEEVWAGMAEGAGAKAGAEPPVGLTNGYVPAGKVLAVDAPQVLEYAWLHEGEQAGTVRWEFARDPDLGTRVELFQTVPHVLSGQLPTVLAAWHTHFELFFAALLGDVRCPWPEDRTEELRKRYADRLG